MDSIRMRSSLVALAAPPALALVLAYVSTAVHRPPVILKWEVQPTPLGRGEPASLHVSATDPDGGALRYEYRAEKGRLTADAAQPGQARYMPPAAGGPDRVTVTVTDAQGLTATATREVATDAALMPIPPVESVMTAIATTTVADTIERSATVDPVASAASPPTRRPETAVATSLPAPPDGAPLPPAADAPLPENARTSAPPPTEPLPQRRAAPEGAPASLTADTPTAAPEVAETTVPNEAPVLEKGTKIEKLGTRSIVLVAQGYEPDGDPIEHEWDTKGCFDILNESERSIEVKFGYCAWGVIRLTWRDPHGHSTFAEWTLSK